MATKSNALRVRELEKALGTALLALWNISGISELLSREGTMDEADFPEHVAAPIRAIHDIASRTSKEVETVP